MNLKSVTKLRIEHGTGIGYGNGTSITLTTGKKPGIRGRHYEITADGKGALALETKDDVTVTFPEENSLQNAVIMIRKGDISVSDMHDLKSLSITGTVGDTELTDVGAKRIILKTMSGTTTVRNSETDRLVSGSMDGDILVSGEISHIEAETISGDIEIDAGSEGSISLSTVAGEMTVKTDTVPDVEFSGMKRKYEGPASDRDSELTIRASAISGSLSVKTV